MLFSFDAHTLFQLLFYIAALGTIIHALIASYHWLSFGENRSQSVLALAVYLIGDAIILLTLAALVFSI